MLATPAPIAPPAMVPAPGTILSRPVKAARPAWVAAVVEAMAISAARSNLILYSWAIRAIMPSWIGTSRVASENGIGLAAAAAAWPPPLRCCFSASFAFRSESISCAAARAPWTPSGATLKGGIEDFFAGRRRAGR